MKEPLEVTKMTVSITIGDEAFVINRSVATHSLNQVMLKYHIKQIIKQLRQGIIQKSKLFKLPE